MGATAHRPRPPPLRQRNHRRRRPPRPTPTPPRTHLRPTTARRTRTRPHRPRARPCSGTPPPDTILHVSHLDELDEYEAELELGIKREYNAVYSLFRYCVLTQDATYLCNKLDMQYLPQASYPLFRVKMEDVWVWDKNRPTRMIPRVEVNTTSDVTVEELRGEGDGPTITAEALAKRQGDHTPDDDDQ
ncbi:MAG: DUF2469 family protein [Actinobacteria bacterium]|nr:DUF2469 family protein [Actinomycetota bacterium]